MLFYNSANFNSALNLFKEALYVLSPSLVEKEILLISKLYSSLSIIKLPYFIVYQKRINIKAFTVIRNYYKGF